eukprot:TRINITY_DN56114_c0_g1_i1.p1 TRINITY_DN56114_c0_g1~~TRINITY_DN56114_c0_g1_i1.p1  ORF type:complete len:603 (-),score=35.29 TRINITY_DN56114_c0_g1_i1:84-1892(-)
MLHLRHEVTFLRLHVFFTCVGLVSSFEISDNMSHDADAILNLAGPREGRLFNSTRNPMLLSPADYVQPPLESDATIKMRFFRLIKYPPSPPEYPNDDISGFNTGDFGWICNQAGEAANNSADPASLDSVPYGKYVYIYNAEVSKRAFSDGIYFQCNNAFCYRAAGFPADPTPGWIGDMGPFDVDEMDFSKIHSGPYYPCMVPPSKVISVSYVPGTQGPMEDLDFPCSRSTVARKNCQFRVVPVHGGTASKAGVSAGSRLVDVIPWPLNATGKEGANLFEALTMALAQGGEYTLRFLPAEEDGYLSREFGQTLYVLGTSKLSFPGCHRKDRGVMENSVLYPDAPVIGRWYSTPRIARTEIGQEIDNAEVASFFDGKPKALTSGPGQCGSQAKPWPGAARNQWGKQCLERVVPVKCIFRHVLNSNASVEKLVNGDLFDELRRALLPTRDEAPLPGCEPVFQEIYSCGKYIEGSGMPAWVYGLIALVAVGMAFALYLLVVSMNKPAKAKKSRAARSLLTTSAASDIAAPSPVPLVPAQTVLMPRQQHAYVQVRSFAPQTVAVPQPVQTMVQPVPVASLQHPQALMVSYPLQHVPMQQSRPISLVA